MTISKMYGTAVKKYERNDGGKWRQKVANDIIKSELKHFLRESKCLIKLNRKKGRGNEAIYENGTV